MSSVSTRANSRNKAELSSPRTPLTPGDRVPPKVRKNSSKANSKTTSMENPVMHCSKQSELVSNMLSSKLLESEQRIFKKIEEEVAMIKSQIANIDVRVTKLESSQTLIDTLKKEVVELKRMIDVQENRAVAADALLYKVPCSPDENLKSMFNHLCHALDIKALPVKNI